MRAEIISYVMAGCDCLRTRRNEKKLAARSYCTTFNTALPLVPFTVAVTFANPVPPSSVAITGLVAVLGAMPMIVDGVALQVASVVRSSPFSFAAVNIRVVPFVRLTVFPEVHDVHVTVTALDVFVHSVPRQTVAVLLTAPAEETFVAVIVTVVDELVTDAAFTTPLLTIATFGSELLHVVPEPVVIFRVVPSLYVPVAVSCSVAPATVSAVLEGVTATVLKLGLTNQSQPTPEARNTRNATAAVALMFHPVVDICRASNLQRA